MKKVKAGMLIAICSLTAIGAAALSSETVTYSYDARGRLVKAVHTGSVNNGVAANYTYDKEHNRAAVNITGAP